MKQAKHNIATTGPGLYEITGTVRRFVDGHPSGLVCLFVRHTSCSLLIQENADPSARADLERFFQRLIPDGNHPDMAWLTHTMEGPDDMPAHLKAAVLPVSLCIPVADGAPQLGSWQGIYLFEHRRAPHRRQVIMHLV